MKQTKRNILSHAQALFNQQGVADVSIRQIAQAMGISHGNLLYHFDSKAAIIRALHDQLLAKAVELNQQLDLNGSMIQQLYRTTLAGFEVVYHFRFFFHDLLYITQTVPEMRNTLIQVEQVRADMYRGVINQAQEKGIMRAEEFKGEYAQFIQHIKIYSDHWISSAAIYESEMTEKIISRYSTLFVSLFYPYLTLAGKKSFRHEILSHLKR